MSLISEKLCFSIIFQLQKKQPWLSERHDEVLELLFADCKTDEQRQLILELLDRFIFLKESDYNQSLHDLADEIVTNPSLESGTTQLVSLTADNYSDSGQSILYALKPRLEKRGWREHLAINRFGSSYKEFHRANDKHKNIIFVDEYIGSGQTVLSRYKELKRVYSEKGINDITIKVFVIAASTVGLEFLKQNNIETFFLHEIKKGISDHSNDINRNHHLDLMSKLEDSLSQRYNDSDLPRMGYGGTESLYGREEGNTPNSVFPIFWWPFYIDEKKRKTILTRAMGDA